MTVDKIFVHHEGAGSPRDDFGFGAPFYTLGIGLHQTHIWRTPETDIATIHFNHVSMGIVLSGDRTTHPVTDDDLRLLTEGVRETHGRGYVTDNPTIQAHREVFGTACPGNKTMDRWPEVVAAIRAGLGSTPAPVPEDDVELILLHPSKPLPNDFYDPDLRGKKPTVVAIKGTNVAFVLKREQLGVIQGVESKEVDPVFFNTLAMF